MHGRITFINSASETGQIFGADRNRYQFHLSSWQEDAPPTRNMEVSFATELYQAVRVRRANGQELTVDIFPESTKAQPAAAAAEPAFDPADTAKAMPEDVARFRDSMDLDETDDEAATLMRGLPSFEEPEPLPTGEILPDLEMNSAAQPQRGRPASPLFQMESGKRGGSAKYYAIGVAATAIMVAVAYAAVHL